MNIRKSTRRLVSAVTIASTLGLAAAPAANAAYVSYGYSAGAPTFLQCNTYMTRALAEKQSYGFTISHLKPCERKYTGQWIGSFRYSKGGVTPV
ncbi:hypothetical protein [Arthrobacter sp. ZGTC412]|uniref:hypothetical protein n=1 Tax=Arthrobacter sp. ZGTC412 TaxID=2058900 RepID=UPI000CE51F35|nr:hypothetical protein [Arthrobacter sp. ZGTC412]